MKRQPSFRTLTSMATATLFATTEARAEPITFFFEGNIDTLVDIGLDESVTIGTPFFGSYAFDPIGVADSAPNNPQFGFYGFQTPCHLAVTIGNYDFTTQDLLLSIENDSLRYDGYAALNWSPFESGGLSWESVDIFLADSTRTALQSDALPLYTPDLAAFPLFTVFSATIPGHLGAVLRGPLTSLTAEPGSLATLAVGAGMLLARRRRR